MTIDQVMTAINERLQVILNRDELRVYANYITQQLLTGNAGPVTPELQAVMDKIQADKIAFSLFELILTNQVDELRERPELVQ